MATLWCFLDIRHNVSTAHLLSARHFTLIGYNRSTWSAKYIYPPSLHFPGAWATPPVSRVLTDTFIINNMQRDERWTVFDYYEFATRNGRKRTRRQLRRRVRSMLKNRTIQISYCKRSLCIFREICDGCIGLQVLWLSRALWKWIIYRSPWEGPGAQEWTICTFFSCRAL